MIREPDCCYQTSLRTLRVLDEAPDGEIVLDRCEKCKTYWRVVVHDPIGLDGSDDQFFQWFERLSDNQARLLLATQVQAR